MSRNCSIGEVPLLAASQGARLQSSWAPKRVSSLGFDTKKYLFPRLEMTYLPPNSCIPSKAKTTMKRKRRKSRLIMDFMELISETTKFLRDAQYLENRDSAGALAVMLTGEQEQSDLGCNHNPRQRVTGGGYVLSYFKYSQETEGS